MEDLKVLADQIKLGKGLQYIIDVDFVSSRGEHYKGQVVVHRPSVGDYLKMGVEKANLLKQFGVDAVDMNLIDDAVKFLATMIAELKVVIDSAPEWLKEIEKIVDYEVLEHIYERYINWVNTFRIESNK